MPVRLAQATQQWVARTVVEAFAIDFRLVDESGADLVREGKLVLPTPHLLVSSHVSFFDILSLNAITPTRFLARADMLSWPVVGAGARAMSTILIDRTSLRTLPGTVALITQALREGDNVVAFPEGTTWCGTSHGTFRPALFQAAIDAGVPVLPVEIKYSCEDGGLTTGPAFVGSDSFFAAVARTVRRKSTIITVRVCTPIEPLADRKELARRSQLAIFGARDRVAMAEMEYSYGLDCLVMPR